MTNTALAVISDADIFKAASRLARGLESHPSLRHDNGDGSIFRVTIMQDVTLIANRYLLVPVDLNRLWHFDKSRLRRPRLLEHLEIEVGMPVRYIASDRGFFYVLEWNSGRGNGAPARAIALPGMVALPSVERDRFALGVADHGPLLAERRELRGVVVGGGPRTGKTSLLRSLAYQAVSNGWILYLADKPLGNTFMPALWSRVPSVAGIATNGSEIDELLTDIDDQCSRRAALFAEAARNYIPPEDLEQFNEWTGSRLPPILFAADEFNTFSHYISMERFADIARRNQKYGLMIVIAAHEWKSDAISKSLSELLETRICFHMASREAIRAVMPFVSPAQVAQLGRIAEQGRVAINLMGHHSLMQAYYLDPERLSAMAVSQAVEKPRVTLTTNEQEIARAAIEELDGYFSIEKLAALGISRRQIVKASKAWADRGWLGPVTDRGRALTDRFADDTGLEQGRPQEAPGRSDRSDDQGDQTDQAPETLGFAGRATERDIAFAEGLIARRGGLNAGLTGV